MNHRALAALLPDLPRWVELRGELLEGHAEVIGLTVDPLAFVVVAPAFGSVQVVGCPPVEAIGEAAGLAGPRLSILVTAESRGWVAAALPELIEERAILHLLGPDARLPDVAAGAVRHLLPGEVTALTHLPAETREELIAVDAVGAPIAAALEADTPVAFCYAGAVTESLWDISIESLTTWRRRGFAAKAVAFEVERLRASGQLPVWGAVESNAASLGLAAKLGFVPTDEVWVFSAPAVPAELGSRPR
ncbi:MAG TPA: GNAT family N-acetyltransferase [Gemmatimonadales bacterium]|nr:GNAT family N-acetyltransferase [Gemmatimonadales bacterium]